MEVFKAKFEKIRLDINSSIKGILDERDVGGNEFHTNSILNAIRESQEKIHDLITRVTVFRSTLKADVRSTPEGKFTFDDETDVVEDDIHNVLEDEGATVQENETVRSIMQRSRQMSEKG